MRSQYVTMKERTRHAVRDGNELKRVVALERWYETTVLCFELMGK